MPKQGFGARLGGALVSQQIARQLCEEIRSGRYALARRLPSEVELASGLGVSRTVVRDALSELERAGYLERVRGVGTVINHAVAALPYRLDQKLEYFEMIRREGHVPHCDSLHVSRLPADPALAQALEAPEGTELLQIRKRVLADDRPVIYSQDYLPAALLAGKKPDRLDLSQPVFDLLAQQAGVEVDSIVCRPAAVYGSAPIRQLLRLLPEQALLLLREVSYDRLCRPVLYSDSYYTDFFDFSILRKFF